MKNLATNWGGRKSKVRTTEETEVVVMTPELQRGIDKIKSDSEQREGETRAQYWERMNAGWY